MRKKKYKVNSLISYTDLFFVVGGEMKPQNGEDSYVFSINDTHALLSVFDGCGGIGSRKYEMYGGKTGAYLASHFCSSLLLKWFKEFCDSGRSLTSSALPMVCEELKGEFTNCLSRLKGDAGAIGIRGSLTRDFPTTTSTVVINKEGGHLMANYIWAGDSRGYVLMDDGIVQVTRDDIYGEDDAYSNLSDDGRLENMICADGKFVLNYRSVVCRPQTIVVTATDGCFGYFYTPMEFEYMLLSTLVESKNAKEWQEKLDAYMLKFTGDDYTLGIAVAGFKTFADLKKCYLPRCKELYKDYICGIETAEPEKRKMLWDRYKIGYYRSV